MGNSYWMILDLLIVGGIVKRRKSKKRITKINMIETYIWDLTKKNKIQTFRLISLLERKLNKKIW